MSQAIAYGRPVVLMILDGWGERAAAPDNAISQARTPHWDRLRKASDVCLLTTHGPAVGLPEGQMGNSEVGHLNIGAGRVVYQDFTRIGQAIAQGQFTHNPALLELIRATQAQSGTLHLMGLLSPGGVHSHEDHLLATMAMARAHGQQKLAIHAFLDGRDCPPRSALPSLQKLQAAITAQAGAQLATVVGRYYAMDRDQRWTRTASAWRAIAGAQAEYQAINGPEALAAAYERGEDDEFVQATVIDGGVPIQAGDGVFIFNFRADRVRQLASVLCDEDFHGFDRGARLPLAGVTTMTRLADDLNATVAFPPQPMNDLLGSCVASAGLKQLRMAETEKYAHVTYFFNGGEHNPCPQESRCLIPSPAVATYDLQPEMSAAALTEQLCDAIQSAEQDLIVVNFANPDMVGHTGSLPAAVAAVEAVDQALGQVADAIAAVGGELIITADHGNAEQMSDPHTGQPHTAHTTNPVPLIHHGQRRLRLRHQGSLRDIAPTVLALLGVAKPEAMTGQSLIVQD